MCHNIYFKNIVIIFISDYYYNYKKSYMIIFEGMKLAKAKKPAKKEPKKEPEKEPAKAKPKATGEPRIITKSALRRLMKEKADAELVASSAIEILMEHLQGLAKDLTTKALKIVENAKRKTITKEDLILAIKE